MPTREVVEVMTPVMMQPMWVTIIIQVLTLFLAAGVSYGMTRAKLSSNEKEIVALQAKMAEIEKDLQIWQRQRLSTVVTREDCSSVQATCRDSICGKIDKLSENFDDYTKTAETNWRIIALTIGRLCEKMQIHPPEFK